LLHGVGDNDDSVILSQLVDQFLDLRGGDGIQRRARLVHQNYLGVDRDGAGDTQPLLLSAGQASARFIHSLFDFLDQAGPFQAVADQLIQFGLGVDHAVNARPVGDIFVNGFREGVGFLEHHADPCPQLHHIDDLVVNIFVIQFDLPSDAANRDGIVHPVQTAQESGFAAAGRADEGDHLVGADIEAYIFDRLFRAVMDVDTLTDHFGVFYLDLANGLPVVVIGGPGAGLLAGFDGRSRAAVQGGFGLDGGRAHDGMAVVLMTGRILLRELCGSRWGEFYQRRSNRLRRTMAKPFIRIMKASSTMIAAEVRSTNARSGRSDQR